MMEDKMICDKCGSDRIMGISSKASDLHFVEYDKLEIEHDGYLPHDLGIGGGDYVEFEYCLDCGKIQGVFPISDKIVKESIEEEYNDDW